MENQHQATHNSKRVSPAALTIGVFFFIIIGLIGVIAYVSHKPATLTTPSNNLTTLGGATGSGNSSCGGQQTLELNIGGQTVETCGQPTMGSATAVSANSITVQSQSGGQSKTFTITSSTKISEHGASKTVSDISTGTTVVVIPSSSDPSQAGYIMINPSMVTPNSN